MDILCDIDGTLADLAHRHHFVATKPKNWPAFAAAIKHDAVIEPVAEVIRDLWNAGNNIFFCSGRNEASRADTCEWLRNKATLWDPDRPGWMKDHRQTGLFMRKDGDYRADDIVKEEILDHILTLGIKPTIVFDDRKRVVDMWRRRGIICAQVAEGNF